MAYEEKTDVGVIIARFQVHELTIGHVDLIKSVYKWHDRVIIFLGMSPLKCTKNNPLDFESRRQMINEVFPDIEIHYIKDQGCNERWSKLLDEKIDDLIGPNHKATLYGSRDSFIQHYTGKNKTTELVPEVISAGCELRKTISRKVKSSSDFRAGVIWATENQYPVSYTTVDIVIYNEDETQILLGRKSTEDKYRFIGGFVDPGESHQNAAKREVKEETNVIITEPKWITSVPINDWRYRREFDKITTVVFKAKILSGNPSPNDDICELRWFNINDIDCNLVENHKIIFQQL